jgi:predicted ATP-dependent endonuclease of OLD family
MKITGIDISDYRLFKNLKFDFTYPADYHDETKRGKPLEKVCFIGQSGTGKTTLLNVIWRFLVLLRTVYQGSIRDGLQANSDIDLDMLNEYVSVQLSTGEDKVSTKFATNRTNNDLVIRLHEFRDWLHNNGLFQLVKNTNKLVITLQDSIAREADAFLFEQKDQLQNFSDFVKTDTQIEVEKKSRQERYRQIILEKTVSLGDMKSQPIWNYLLKDIEEYAEGSRALVMNLMQKAQGASAGRVVEELQKWIASTPNPRRELAEKCLNPILSRFFLEVDTESGTAPITLRTKAGVKIDSSYLSTGTRQILATAIPIYKFDTTDTVILFDEPERSLFPDVQRELVQYYTSLAPTAQFFFATHSPIIAAAFEPCERFILYFDENGEVNFRNGTAPEGDDPNDVLSADFGMDELMGDKGVEAYQRYRKLFVEIRNETDPTRKQALVVEQAKLGDQYKF